MIRIMVGFAPAGGPLYGQALAARLDDVAVVADEVGTHSGEPYPRFDPSDSGNDRTLAKRGLLLRSNHGAKRLLYKDTAEQARSGQAALAQITTVIAEINDMTSQIATAAEE